MNFLKIMWLLKATIIILHLHNRKKVVLLFMQRNKLNSLDRADLKIQDIDFESTWIEIKNKTSKNIICGCIY